MSIKYAVGKGDIIVPTTKATTIHELSSTVMGMGDVSDKRIGNVGDVHPYATAADNIISVAKHSFAAKHKFFLFIIYL